MTLWWHCDDTLSLCQRWQRSLQPFHSQGFRSKKPLEIKLQIAWGRNSRAACVAARSEAHRSGMRTLEVPKLLRQAVRLLREVYQLWLHQFLVALANAKEAPSQSALDSTQNSLQRMENSTQHTDLEKGNRIDQLRLSPPSISGES